MKNKITTAAVTGAVLFGSVVGAGTAFAATDTPDASGHRDNHPQGMFGQGHGERPALFGTVTAINGTTLTVTGKENPRQSTAEGTYSVDASNAKVTKDHADATVSSIAAGDMVMVAGTVNGTTVTATMIHDGIGPKPEKPAFEGNGQPVVGGTVSAVSGSTLTITNKSNVSYTVDGSNAAVVSKGATAALSSVAVGDAVVVQGAVNGASVTASTIIDNGTIQTGAAASGNGQESRGHGFFGAIGGFFHSLFGFF